MTMSTHMSEAKAKIWGYFHCIRGNQIRAEQRWGVEFGHWATPVLVLEIRHNINHYCSMPSLAPVVHSRPPLSVVANMLNKREESGEDCTWRGR